MKTTPLKTRPHPTKPGKVQEWHPDARCGKGCWKTTAAERMTQDNTPVGKVGRDVLRTKALVELIASDDDMRVAFNNVRRDVKTILARQTRTAIPDGKRATDDARCMVLVGAFTAMAEYVAWEMEDVSPDVVADVLLASQKCLLAARKDVSGIALERQARWWLQGFEDAGVPLPPDLRGAMAEPMS